MNLDPDTQLESIVKSKATIGSYVANNVDTKLAERLIFVGVKVLDVRVIEDRRILNFTAGRVMSRA